ncbi:hypothetical protein GCM10010521_22650 [Streptomyces rameus]|uniref:Uncharacterized protein n=1 Tax=Streptomyces rameus TaxID=68261 RepID=A0ABP6N5J2_9ACTN
MPVSAKTATKLRDAMARLLAGEPLHTNGALTKENLAREAQVSHATVHRADDILTEWNAKVARDETIAALHKQLREARVEITQLNGKLDALATVTANLFRQSPAPRPPPPSPGTSFGLRPEPPAPSRRTTCRRRRRPRPSRPTPAAHPPSCRHWGAGCTGRATGGPASSTVRRPSPFPSPPTKPSSATGTS